MKEKNEEKEKTGIYYSLKKFLQTECSSEFCVSDLINSIGRSKGFEDLRNCSNTRIYDVLNLMIRQGYLVAELNKDLHPKKFPVRVFRIKYKQLNK